MTIRSTAGFLVAALSLILSGCSSAPTQVHANIPLVKRDKYIPLLQQDRSRINIVNGSIERGELVTINNQQYKLSQSYYSASGYRCIKADLISNSNRHHTMCDIQGQWTILAPLISEGQ